jgi:hypothetical protein
MGLRVLPLAYPEYSQAYSARQLTVLRSHGTHQVTVLRSLAPELAISFEDLLWLGFFYRVPPKARAPLGGIGRRAGGRAHARVCRSMSPGTTWGSGALPP